MFQQGGLAPGTRLGVLLPCQHKQGVGCPMCGRQDWLLLQQSQLSATPLHKCLSQSKGEPAAQHCNCHSRSALPPFVRQDLRKKPTPGWWDPLCHCLRMSTASAQGLQKHLMMVLCSGSKQDVVKASGRGRWMGGSNICSHAGRRHHLTLEGGYFHPTSHPELAGSCKAFCCFAFSKH